MKTNITLFAMVCDFEPLTVTVKGETFTIGKDVVDLSVIPEGFRLPAANIASKWFTPGSHVVRHNGELSFSLILPVTPASSFEMRNPAPILVTKDGKLAIPKDEPPEELVVPIIEEIVNDSEIGPGGLVPGGDAEDVGGSDAPQ